MNHLNSLYAPSQPAALDALPPAITVTLNDGTVVTNTDPRWRVECMSRFNHLTALRWLRKVEERQDYFATVHAKEGETAATRLKLAYAADWQDRKAKVQAAQAQIDQAGPLGQLRAAGAL